ncbi:hypothetical protein [Clostridium sp. HBUAS56017]|uniref:hypothetical protein n=1 Tax=Clostridium sp. HBUAS56017 TaxID=2571128 RepID=UPI0011784F69|nr:hypothetical protein [Clostridium sp. HBUAS56017]
MIKIYTTSEEYKRKIKESSRTFQAKVTIGNKIFTNDDIVEIKLDGNIQPQDSFMIGTTTSQTLDLTLLNKGDTIYSANQIKLEIGLNIGSTIEYILMGYYNIDDVEKTDYTIKFTSYDNMIKFETPYFGNLGDATLQQIVDELSKITGVQFTGVLPKNYTVKKLEGLTCREILGYVASLCGGSASITREGKFTIVYPTECGIKLTGDNYFDYKREEVNYKIGKITCENGQKSTVSVGALGTDSMELTFQNPWVTESILNDIYTKLNGFEYLGYTMKWQGDISLDLGDIIIVTDVKGVVRKLPILSQKFTYVGGLTCELAAKGENKNKNSFSSNGNINKKINRVVYEQALINEALINKANISDLVAKNIKVDLVEGKTAILQNILTNFITGDSGQFLHLTGQNVVIEEATIKSAMIKSVTVDQIEAGEISTNRFRIVSDSGKMLIADNTIQIKDANRVRVQIGKDASSDYNMYVWDATGKLMFDATGLKADGIKAKIIRDDMVSDTANIDGKKINISSLITEMNKDTNTQLIKASKVALDTEGQSLEISFKNLKSNVENIQVGGRNLIMNSAPNNLANWGSAGATHTKEIIVETTAPNQNVIKVTYSVAGIGGIYKTSIQKPTVGNQYSWSVWVKASRDLNVNIGSEMGGVKECSVTTIWQRFTYTFTAREVNQYYAFVIYVQNAAVGDILYLHSLKLEEGNKATSWSPAPEDIDYKIEANTTSINTINGKIDTLIKNTTIVKDGATIQLKDAYSTLIQDVNGISTKVSKIKTDIVDPALLSQNLILQFNDIVNGTFNGNTFTKNTGGIAWNGGFASVNTLSNGEYVEFTVSKLNTHIMFGLSAKNTDADYKTIDFAIYQTYNTTNNVTTQVLQVYEKGLNKGSFGNITIGDKLRVSIESNKVLYYKNGELVYTSLVEPTLPMVIDASFYEQSSEARDIKIGTTLSGISTRLSSAETKLTDSAFTIQINRNFNRVYKVRYIRDWCGEGWDSSNTRIYPRWREIEVINNKGINIVRGKVVTGGGATVPGLTYTVQNGVAVTDGIYEYNKDGYAEIYENYNGNSGPGYGTYYIQIDLNQVHEDIDLIKVWHEQNMKFGGTKTEISEDGVNWTAIFDSSVSGNYVETQYGHTIKLNINNINTMMGSFNENGLTLKNGAIRILNNVGAEVLKGDEQGNLAISGEFSSVSKNVKTSLKDGKLVVEKDGVRTLYISSTGLYTENFGSQIIFSKEFLNIYGDNPELRRVAVEKEVPAGKSSAGLQMYDSAGIEIKDERLTIRHPSAITIKTDTVNSIAMNSDFGMKLYNYNEMSLYGNDINISLGRLTISQSNDFWMLSKQSINSTTIGEDRGSSWSGFARFRSDGLYVWGNIACSGSKTRAVDTKKYGVATLNAYETAECIFGDLGEGVLDETGVCYVFIDPVLLETINTKCNYQVWITDYGEKEDWVKCVQKEENYFIVKGTPGLTFGWEFKAKQRDYETSRLEIIETNYDKDDYLTGLDVPKDDGLGKIGQDYYEKYEKELIAE